ncbi:MAG: hypothetical protein UZ13_00056 [Chloroflexi bacterium OLB13]|nr:MAG: hypothetical protein UZ13_00056 [Chloroflexi bacterium OLB13]
MSKKTAASPFQALEEEAYHAFREWPVWLVLRERELDAHLTAQRPPNAPGTGATSEKQSRHSALDQGGK